MSGLRAGDQGVAATGADPTRHLGEHSANVREGKVQAGKQLYDLVGNKEITCFQALTNIVGEITLTLGGDLQIDILASNYEAQKH